MAKPLVSFLMPTYGRASRQPKVMAEALYWFTRQTIYDQCELIVLNDCSTQVLTCRTVNVRVVNLQERFPSLGDKMNYLVEIAQGEICCIYEDDDISLPHRAEQAVAKLTDYEFFYPRMYYYEHIGEGLEMQVDLGGVQHQASAYRRQAFLGKYSSTSQGHDAIAQGWALAHLKCNPIHLTPPETSYVYRWGVSDFHLSAMSPNMNQSYATAPCGAGGSFRLEPVMVKDYEAIHQRLSQSGQRPKDISMEEYQEMLKKHSLPKPS